MRQLAGLLLLVAVCVGEVITKNGYLLTAPKVFQAGTSERACLTLHKLEGPGRSVRMEFYEPSDGGVSEESFILFQKEAKIPDRMPGSGEYCFDIAIPATVTARSADVRMALSSPQFSYLENNTVTIKPETMITLVQTDKAKYQPGQRVLFRIITLRHDLTALKTNLDEVWIATPQGMRVAQWTNIGSAGPDTSSLSHGMVQLDFQLTEEPPLGSWTIHAKTPLEVIVKSFVVEEYVLPTFEVVIEAPESIHVTASTLTVQVCAKYTFGKPLINANVALNATVGEPQPTYISDHQPNRYISEKFVTDERGCADFDLLVSNARIGDSDYRVNTIELNVEVEEEGTGMKQSATKKVSRRFSGIQMEEVGAPPARFFKPGVPLYGQYIVKRENGRPAAKQIVEVCYTAGYKDKAPSVKKLKTPDAPLYRANKKYEGQVESVFGFQPLFWTVDSPPTRTTRRSCREYETDDRGAIFYQIPAQVEDVDDLDVDVRTETEVDSAHVNEFYRAFFSPSGSYISIDTHKLPDILPCSGDVSVSILTSLRPNTAAPERMVYKIMSRGKIINVGHTGVDLTFPVLHKMSPEFKLLVYYLLDSGEVVSDSRVMKVAKCFPQQVQVNWDQETVKPGDSASLTIRAAPNSVCGVSAVDRSVELLGTGNQITMDTVFSRLDQFVINSYQSPNQVHSDDEHCRSVERQVSAALTAGGATSEELTDLAEKIRPETEDTFQLGPFSTDRGDTMTVFDSAGFLVMSNLQLENRPCYKAVPALDVPEEEEEDSENAALLSTQEHIGVPRIDDSAPIAQDDDGLEETFQIKGGSKARQRGGVGAGQDEDQETSPEQIRAEFPEAFLFSIETVSADGIKTLTSEMPDTITSWVGSAICTNEKDGFGLSNKSSITTFKPFFTEVTLPYSLKRGEILNMSASVFNFLESSLSVYLELGESPSYDLADAAAPAGYDLCIAPGRTVVNYFPMTFTDLGEVNITVSVRVKDGNCDEANAVRPSGDTVIRSIIIKPEGFPQVETTSRFICLDKGDYNHVETVELPVRDELVPDSERAFFSVIGDLLGPTYQNLESGLIDAPTGGGEPNMITFVPNIYIRAYLEEAGLLTEMQKRQTNNNMKSGYQRQLRYRRDDGSFSSYGPEDLQGSVWLTAFVVQAFKDASKYIDIDEASTIDAVNFLLRNRNKYASDGCFAAVGDVIHKEMLGGVERGGRAALTAFVMLALKDSINDSGLPAILSEGLTCLDQSLEYTNKTLYSEVLMAYAYLIMGEDVKGKRLVEKLMTQAKREGYDVLFWEGDRSSIYGGSRSVDIEMTSYMVLALLQISGKGYLEDAARAVRWINTQRNDRGGFVSTQDTIVAIRALTAFADRTFSSELTSSVTVTSSKGQSAELSVDPSNRLLLQQQKVPDLELPGSLQFEVTPSGCVVLQSTFKYSSRLRVPNPAFSLDIVTNPRGCGGSYEIEVCTSYLRTPGRADRVILDVELPSGYIPVDSTLRELREDKPADAWWREPVARKYKSKDGKVTFTLQTVTEDKTCLPFRIIQETEVRELKPAVVNVYDFYRPEDRNMMEYELAPACV